MCLRFTASILSPQICEGPRRKDCASQLHLFNRRISPKLEIRKLRLCNSYSRLQRSKHFFFVFRFFRCVFKALGWRAFGFG